MRIGWVSLLGTCVVVACVGEEPVLGGGPGTLADAGANDATSSGDASSDDGAAPRDAADDGPTGCRLDAPFGAPEPIAAINDPTASTAYPRPTAQGIYFASARASDAGTSDNDLWFAPRTATGYGTATRLVASTAAHDGAPTETSDGLTLYFDAALQNTRRLWRSSRNTKSDPFTTAEPFGPVVPGSFEERTPYVVGDALYLAARSSSVALGVLYRVSLADGLPTTGAPTAVPGIDAGWDVAFPVVSLDEKTIYFARIISDAKIHVATRKTAAGPFDTAKPVDELNIGVNTVPTAISANGCELYLHAVNNQKKFDAYVARKPP